MYCTDDLRLCKSVFSWFRRTHIDLEYPAIKRSPTEDKQYFVELLQYRWGFIYNIADIYESSNEEGIAKFSLG